MTPGQAAHLDGGLGVGILGRGTGWSGRLGNSIAWATMKLFLFLRQVSRSAYSYYGLGDEVQLTVEIIPVRLR